MIKYKEIKDKLQTRVCSAEKMAEIQATENATDCERLATTDHGDFSACYAVKDIAKGLPTLLISADLLNTWGLTEEELQADAMAADRKRGIMFLSIEGILSSINRNFDDSSFPDNVWNLWDKHIDLSEYGLPLFCLTNRDKIYGANLILQKGIRRTIGKMLGCNYFVLPSSVHEVLIFPDNGGYTAENLNNIVAEVNSTEVAEHERLSDKVQWVNGLTGKMQRAK